MGDKYYGIFQGDDASYSNYAAVLHQQQQQHQHHQQNHQQFEHQSNQNQQSIMQFGLNTHKSELNNYVPNIINTNSMAAAAAAAAAAATTATASHALDVCATTIQNPLVGQTLRYYGCCYNNQGIYGSQQQQLQEQQQQQQQKQLLYNGSSSSNSNSNNCSNLILQQNVVAAENCTYSIFPNACPLSLCTPLTACAHSVGGAMVAATAPTATSMSYSCNRNRYMPYNRTINVNNIVSYQQQQQEQHSLQAAIPLPPVQNSLTPLTTNQQQQQQPCAYTHPTNQQYTNIYQNYSNSLCCPPHAITTSDNSCNKNSLSDLNTRSLTGSGPLMSDCGNTTRHNVSDSSIASSTLIMDEKQSSNADNSENANLSSDSSSQSFTNSSSQSITLQITNLDYTIEESILRYFLLGQLRPITPVLSLIFEGSSYAKVTVPDMFFAKQVVAYLHRKKIGHKRMLVSYTRDSSQTDLNTLRCQVAGLLKDVPFHTLPMYKFRELFQARFKTSISVVDLYKLPDICTITVDEYEEKFIGLQTGVINSLDNSPLMEGLQDSVPYCPIHFKREQHKGWAEQDIEPLPNVWMTIAEIQTIIYPLIKNHIGDIPIASLVHCISGQMQVKIVANEKGVNLEHLVCCVQGIQTQINSFGIKILGWLEGDKQDVGSHDVAAAATLNTSNGFNGTTTSTTNVTTGTTTTTTTPIERSLYAKSACALSDPLYQISREVIELVKMSPKSTMKFNRFIPAYHNHFGKQCRVADYGYTKLIELFEALSSVVQIIGDGENRLITLTHRTQLRRFTSDLLRILRAHGNKPVLLSQLPGIFTQTQHRRFDVTDYGVCDIRDLLDGLANSNIVVMSRAKNGCDGDMLISMPKRKQTTPELEKTIVFAGEMVELFRNAPQYTILFQKFVRSYHYHFAYQCRLSDYGFLKLADLMEAIQGIVEMEQTNDEDKKIYLSSNAARRVFAEQCEDLVHDLTGNAQTCMKLEEVLELHKKKFGYQILAQTLGVNSLAEGVELLPYIELTDKEKVQWITCHREDVTFRKQCYFVCKLVLDREAIMTTTGSEGGGGESSISKEAKENVCKNYTLKSLIEEFNKEHEDHLNESKVKAMKHFIEIFMEEDVLYVRTTDFLKFILCIIRLVEKRTIITLAEIRNTLHCKIKTTFEFGFPNLYTVLTAYNDIFKINPGSTQDRSEISLQPNCKLHLSVSSNRSAFLSAIKTQSGKQLKTTRSLRTPLSENTNNNNNGNRRSYNSGPTPAKTRAHSSMTNDISNSTYQGSQAYKRRISTATQPPLPPLKAQRTTTASSQRETTQTMPMMTQVQRSQMPPTYQRNNANLSFEIRGSGTYINHMNSNGNSSIYSVASHNSSLNTSASSSIQNNEENSFNTSFGGIANNSLNSSNISMSISELNASRCQFDQSEFSYGAPTPTPSIPLHANSCGNVKLWERRYVAANAVGSMAPHNQQMALVENVPCQSALIMATSENEALDAHCHHQHQMQQQQQQEHQQQQYQQQQSFQSSMEHSVTITQPKVKQELNNNEHTYTHIYPMFEPPKPDTPPSNNMPYWIDPIWSDGTTGNELAPNGVLNIKLPESYNVLPMVLSPYTLSKTENLKRKVFNFDNHDRKIS